MDSYTLLLTLLVVAWCNVIFTFAIGQDVSMRISWESKLSASLLLVGFSVFALQPFISNNFLIVGANYMVLMGFYFQIVASLPPYLKKRFLDKRVLGLISVLFLLSFGYFTSVNLDSTAQLLIFSGTMVMFYLAAVLTFREDLKRPNVIPESSELCLLYLVAMLFYVALTLFGLFELVTQRVVLNENVVNSTLYLYMAIFILTFFIGMIGASLRHNNRQIKIQRDKINYLFAFISDTAKSLELTELYQSIEEILRRSFGVPGAGIFLTDPSGETHTLTFVFNELDLPLGQVTTLQKGEGVAGQSIEEDRVIMVNVDKYPNESIAKAFKERGVANFVSVPLNTPKGIIGAITMVTMENLDYEEIFDDTFFYYLGEQVGLVLSNALLYEELNVLASIDAMTGLLNRRKTQEKFAQEVQRMKRHDSKMSVAVADLDFFKKINDTAGHECGDNVIKSAAETFREECRETDFICRWGGEEFLLVFPETGLAQAKSVVERIRTNFEQRHHSCLNGLNSTLSIGLSEYQPGQSMEQVIAVADAALYEAKRNGRNRVEVKLGSAATV